MSFVYACDDNGGTTGTKTCKITQDHSTCITYTLKNGKVIERIQDNGCIGSEDQCTTFDYEGSYMVARSEDPNCTGSPSDTFTYAWTDERLYSVHTNGAYGVCYESGLDEQYRPIVKATYCNGDEYLEFVEFTYDDEGRQIESSFIAGCIFTTEDWITTYDDGGKITDLANCWYDTDPETESTIYTCSHRIFEYNSKGQVTSSRIFSELNDIETDCANYVYNSSGHLVSDTIDTNCDGTHDETTEPWNNYTWSSGNVSKIISNTDKFGNIIGENTKIESEGTCYGKDIIKTYLATLMTYPTLNDRMY